MISVNYFFLLVIFLFQIIGFPSLIDAQEKKTKWDQITSLLNEQASISDIRQALANRPIDSIRDADHNTLFMIACKNNQLKLAKILLQLESNINAENNLGLTALLQSVFENHLDVFHFLLENKADINLVDKIGRSPLHIAIMQGNKNLAQELLKNQADIEAKDINGWTPLFYAIHENNTEMAKLLIENNANVNAQSAIDKTPLHLATQKNNFEIVNLLIQSGAKVNQRDKIVLNPQTALNINQNNLVNINISNEPLTINKLLLAQGAKSARNYFQNNWSLNIGYNFGSITNDIIQSTAAPLNNHYLFASLEYYVIPEFSMSWEYSYGTLSGYSHYTTIGLPGTIAVLQNLFSFLTTSYQKELHGSARGFFYTLIGISALLPQKFSWNIYLNTLQQFISFSLFVNIAKVNFVIPQTPQAKEPNFYVDLSGLVGGSLNFLVGQHLLSRFFFNMGISYSQLEFIWNTGFSLGILF